MTKSDFNRLSGERRSGLMNELVSVRDGVVESAWLKVQTAAMAMDPAVTREVDEHTPVIETQATASVPEANTNANFPMQQLTGEKNMLTEEDDPNTQMIDQMAAEANVERAYQTANGDEYELAA